MKISRYLNRFLLFVMAASIVASCAVNKPKKRQQPKNGPIPCPVKDC